MKGILSIVYVFCILVMLSCAHKKEATPQPEVEASVAHDSVPKTDKSVILRIDSDTLTLPVGKIDVTVVNNTDTAYTTGVDYKIERFDKGVWTRVPIKYGSFTDLGYVVKANGGKLTFTINLQNVKPAYQKGMYRIGKPVGVIRQGSHYIYVTFYIK